MSQAFKCAQIGPGFYPRPHLLFQRSELNLPSQLPHFSRSRRIPRLDDEISAPFPAITQENQAMKALSVVQEALRRASLRMGKLKLASPSRLDRHELDPIDHEPLNLTSRPSTRTS